MKPDRLRGSLRPQKSPPRVQACPSDAFGHTGFTGTSCWIDAERQRVFVLLTNRTHARQPPFANINAVRREFHSLAVEALNNREN